MFLFVFCSITSVNPPLQDLQPDYVSKVLLFFY